MAQMSPPGVEVSKAKTTRKLKMVSAELPNKYDHDMVIF